MNPTHSIRFGTGKVDYYFDASFRKLGAITDKKHSVILTDEHVFSAHKEKFRGWNVICLKPGEEYKIQATADAVIETLIGMEADRKTTLIGVGGGVITDLAGYVASVYMRGIKVGFVPTTILAMVDAAIGGKNGIDVGEYKNMVGLIRQPSFLLYDTSLLQSLPDPFWSDGFAEVIKHACIRDAAMFRTLEAHSLSSLRKKKALLAGIIRSNALLKSKVVQKDELEKGDRKLLNFGHTLGHAIETQYEICHGQAVSIGMHYACLLSEALIGFKDTERVDNLLTQYGLPVDASFKLEKVLHIMKMDKKRMRNTIHYVLLKSIGKGVLHELEFKQLEKLLQNIVKA
jgi:3-dehydroquinate synthase